MHLVCRRLLDVRRGAFDGGALRGGEWQHPDTLRVALAAAAIKAP